MAETFTEQQIRDHLRETAEGAGGVSAWARARDFSPQYVHSVIAGERPLSPRILGELGFERITRYITKVPTHGEKPKSKTSRTARPQQAAD